MAKDTSMLKCPETVSGCKTFKFGNVINLSRAITNSGFILNFDVDCSGFRPDKEYIKMLGRKLSVVLDKSLDDFVTELFLSKDQLELF